MSEYNPFEQLIKIFELEADHWRRNEEHMSFEKKCTVLSNAFENLVQFMPQILDKLAMIEQNRHE